MRLAITTLALGLIVSPAFADLTITSKVTHDGGDPQTAVSYMSSDHVRVAQPDGNEIMVNFATGDMTMINGAKKQYWVMTKQDWDAISAKMKNAMASPEMKNLPPEVQQKMQAMMGGMMTVNVAKTGNSRTVAGFKCDEYTISIGEFSKSTECVTKDVKLPVEAWARYKDFADRIRTMMAAMGPMAKNLDAMQEQLKKVQGFPVASSTTLSIMGRNSSSTSEVTGVKEGAIPATAWQVPAGFTKVDNPAAKALAR
jgi:hypothetical protein